MAEKKPTIHELRAFILEVAEWSRDELLWSEGALSERQHKRVAYFHKRGFDLLGDISVADAEKIREKGKGQS